MEKTVKHKNSYPMHIMLELDDNFIPYSARFIVCDPTHTGEIYVDIPKRELHKIITYYKVNLIKANKVLRDSDEGCCAIINIYCDRKGNSEIVYAYGIET